MDCLTFACCLLGDKPCNCSQDNLCCCSETLSRGSLPTFLSIHAPSCVTCSHTRWTRVRLTKKHGNSCVQLAFIILVHATYLRGSENECQFFCAILESVDQRVCHPMTRKMQLFERVTLQCITASSSNGGTKVRDESGQL